MPLFTVHIFTVTQVCVINVVLLHCTPRDVLPSASCVNCREGMQIASNENHSPLPCWVDESMVSHHKHCVLIDVEPSYVWVCLYSNASLTSRSKIQDRQTLRCPRYSETIISLKSPFKRIFKIHHFPPSSVTSSRTSLNRSFRYISAHVSLQNLGNWTLK